MRYVTATLGALLYLHRAPIKNAVCKEFHESGSSFADHAMLPINYLVSVHSVHKVKVTTGISFEGNLFGSRKELKRLGNFVVTGYGFGSVSIEEKSRKAIAFSCVDLSSPDR